MKTILILTAVLSLTACTIPQYALRSSDPRITSYQANKDNMECRRTAMQEASMNGLDGNMFAEVQVSRLQNECLGSLGYYKMRVR